MENPTEFDLNAAMQRWREQLSQSPNFRQENLEELETHLRDAVSAWRGRGLSEEEAILVATRRIGGALALETEFAKVNVREIWLNRLLWMLAGALLWRVVGYVSISVESNGSLAMASSISNNVVWMLEVIALVFATLLLARRQLNPPKRALPT
jgi:hypothetical protein